MIVPSCGVLQSTGAVKVNMDAKQQVRALLKSIETGEPEPIASINPQKYVQHNLGVADGLAGFVAHVAQLPKGSAKVETVRVFQDGDFVFAHTDYDLFGPKIGSTSSDSSAGRSSSTGTTCRRSRRRQTQAAAR